MRNIIRAAKDAAQASMDAHGKLVDPRDAWDFIKQVSWDSEGDVYGYMEKMPEEMPVQFAFEYYRAKPRVAR